MPLGLLVAVKKAYLISPKMLKQITCRLILSNSMAVAVPRYMEHGNRRKVALALCRRRTVSRFFVQCALQGNSFSHFLGNDCNSMRFVAVRYLLN